MIAVPRLLALLLLTTIFAAGTTAHAATPPQGLVADILGKDFRAVGTGRNGHVVYSEGKAPEVSDCGCGARPETFDARTDPIVIVSAWWIVAARPSGPDGAVVTAQFHVLAETVRTGGEARGIVRLAPPRDERLTYRLSRRQGQWMLVDPPLPRVGVVAEMATMRQGMALDRALMRDHPRTAPGWAGWQAHHDRSRRQVGILQRLKP